MKYLYQYLVLRSSSLWYASDGEESFTTRQRTDTIFRYCTTRIVRVQYNTLYTNTNTVLVQMYPLHLTRMHWKPVFVRKALVEIMEQQ